MPDSTNLQYLRSKEWWNFSKLIIDHIESYTVPQYGDKGEDPCTNYSPEDFVRQLEKYLKRYGKNARPGQQELDLIKIAHYAGMLHSKITGKDK